MISFIIHGFPLFSGLLKDLITVLIRSGEILVFRNKLSMLFPLFFGLLRFAIRGDFAPEEFIVCEYQNRKVFCIQVLFRLRLCFFLILSVFPCFLVRKLKPRIAKLQLTRAACITVLIKSQGPSINDVTQIQTIQDTPLSPIVTLFITEALVLSSPPP